MLPTGMMRRPKGPMPNSNTGGGLAAQKRAHRWCLILLIAVLLVSLIGCALFVVKSYFLPQLQRHRNRGLHKASHQHHKTPAGGDVNKANDGDFPAAEGQDGKGETDKKDNTKGDKDATSNGDDEDDSGDFAIAVLIFFAALLASLPIPTLYTATCIGSGFALGFKQAILVVIPAVALGIAGMFVVSRKCLHDITSSWIKRSYPGVHRMCHSAASAGPIVIMRFTPIPFAIQTMLWGSCSPVPFKTFFPPTIMVVAPQITMFAWFGASTTNLAQALNTRNPMELVILGGLGLGFLLGYRRLSAWARAHMAHEQEMAPASPTEPTVKSQVTTYV